MEARTTSSVDSHIVGRTGELAALHAGLQRVFAGESLLLCAVGEAGIGKTTLIETFLDEITGKDHPACTIARGQCSERLAGTEAYLPFLDLLGNLLQHTAAAMRGQAPWWYAQVASLSTDNPSDARILDEVKHATQERIKRELASFLQEISRPRPLLLFIEDLHWADVSTIDMLAYLGAQFDVMRLLIVTTYRPTEMVLVDHPFLQIKPDLLSRGRCQEIELRFLTRDDTEHYLSLEYSGHQFPSDFADMIHQRTEGSPLFMVDLLRDLQERGVLSQDEGQWRIGQQVSEIKLELPSSVKGMIERKIGELSKGDHELLTVASVQGFDFDSGLLARVLSLDEEHVEDRLQVLDSKHRFVQFLDEKEMPNGTLTLRYRFVHILYQNQLYSALIRTRLARLSRAVAEGLEAYFGQGSSEVASELAALYTAARNFDKATSYYCTAAKHAIELFSFLEAKLLAESGLELVPKLPDSEAQNQRELELRITLGSAATAAFGYGNQQVGETYGRIHELTRKIEPTREAVLSTFGLHSYYLSNVDLQSALELCGWWRETAQDRDDLALRFFGDVLTGVTLNFKGDFGPALEYFGRATESYERSIDEPLRFVSGQDVVLVAWNNHPLALWLGGSPSQATRWSDEAAELANARSNPHVLTHNLCFAGMQRVCMLEPKKVLELSEKNIAVCEKYELPWPLAWGRILKGWAIAQQGAGEQGLSLMRSGLESWSSMGFRLWREVWHAEMAKIHLQMGQPERGLELIEQSLADMDGTLSRMWEVEIRRVHADLHSALDPASNDAEGYYREAIDVARQRAAKSFELRATASLSRLLQKQGRLDEARQLLGGIYGWFTEGFETRDLQEAKELLDHLG